jgi:hypothetical protein
MTTATFPQNDAEVFTDYFAFIKWHVVKAKIEDRNVEDVAMDLLLRYLERGGVEDLFDPERGVLFRTALSGFCRSYLYHIKEQEVKQTFRYGLSANRTVGDDEDTPILDLQGYVTPDQTEDTDTSVEVSRIRRKIAHSGDAKLLLFFDMVMLQVEEHGQIDVAELTSLFNVSSQTIHNWKKRLRHYFDGAL